MNVIDQLAYYQIVPVTTLHSPSEAAGVAEALVAAGLKVIEVTFRTDAALECLQAISGRSDLLVGAGTVLTAAQADAAIDAGARFIVSPGLSAAVVERCQQRGVAVTPGVATPSDLMAASELGLDVVKFFPAESMGGVRMLKALAAPFREMRFVPTGGVNAENLADYLAMPQVIACGGSWMVKPKLYEDGDYARVTAAAQDALAAAQSAQRV